MKETIYTIPINEAFDRYDGCPLCELRTKLDAASLEYVMGAAMMEPDVRVKTNEQGFCAAHLGKMLAVQNRLSLALILESRLPELDAALFLRVKKPLSHETDLKKARAAAADASRGCFVCGRVAGFMEHYYNNIIYLWDKEQDFRAKFDRQPYFCVPHYAGLLARSEERLSKKAQAVFAEGLTAVCRARLNALKSDVSAFCKGFDYRNAGQPQSAEVAAAVERAAAFLVGGE